MNNWFIVLTAQTPIFLLSLGAGLLFDGAFYPVRILNELQHQKLTLQRRNYDVV